MQAGIHPPPGAGREAGYLPVAFHHQTQGRRLHPAHGEHALVPPVHQRAGAGHVDADQPVGAGARQSSLIQRIRAVAGSQRSERLVDTGVIQR